MSHDYLTLCKVQFQISVNPQVKWIDGVFGHFVYLLIKPVFDQENHLVMEEEIYPNTYFLISSSYVVNDTSNTIQ